jgi:hypothetical protein
MICSDLHALYAMKGHNNNNIGINANSPPLEIQEAIIIESSNPI